MTVSITLQLVCISVFILFYYWQMSFHFSRYGSKCLGLMIYCITDIILGELTDILYCRKIWIPLISKEGFERIIFSILNIGIDINYCWHTYNYVLTRTPTPLFSRFYFSQAVRYNSLSKKEKKILHSKMSWGCKIDVKGYFEISQTESSLETMIFPPLLT